MELALVVCWDDQMVVLRVEERVVLKVALKGQLSALNSVVKLVVQ